MIRNYSIQYIAGLVDGEGCFMIVHQRCKLNVKYARVRFMLANQKTNEFVDIVNALRSEYGGSITIRKPKYNGKEYATMLWWNLEKRRDLLRFLNDIIPYLKIKRKDAENIREAKLKKHYYYDELKNLKKS